MSIDTLIGGTGAAAAVSTEEKIKLSVGHPEHKVHGIMTRHNMSDQSSSKINNSSSVALRTFATS